MVMACAMGCSKKLLCHRWTAPNYDNQVVGGFMPHAETGICDFYLPNAVALADTSHLINHNED